MADTDLDAMLARMARSRVNRRGFLAAAGFSSMAAFLAACAAQQAASPSTGAAGASGSAAPSAGSAAPSAGDVEDEFFMYNWSDYISPDNIKAFEERYDLTMQYDIYADNEVLLATLQGGASGYDVAAPTAEYVPGMREEGFIQKLDLSRIPNVKHISKDFKGLWWDPTDEWQVPKDFGTTGILYRSDLLSRVPESWRDFYDLIKTDGSGKTIFVTSQGDIFAFPLKMLGYSLNSVEKSELDEAREILLDVAPHLLALDSDTYGDRLASGEANMVLGWTGPLALELADLVAEEKAGYTVPSEGTLFWMDTWVMLADAPHPNAAYAWLDFIHEPEIQAEETNFNGYGTCNDAAREFIDPAILEDPAYFPPEDVMARLEEAEDTSGSTQRADIMEEFRQAIG
jgi:spermidine/putrescine transport system substrate-binding protein